jgi:hypothetical protein
MASLSRSELDRMLANAEASQTVAYPNTTFCDVLTMALEAAHSHPSPAFTLRELETLLFDCTHPEVIQFDAKEFASMVKLAMEIAEPRQV